MQIECINDGIGMVYSGMGPDFRLVTDTSLLLLLLLLIPPSLLSLSLSLVQYCVHVQFVFGNTVSEMLRVHIVLLCK